VTDHSGPLFEGCVDAVNDGIASVTLISRWDEEFQSDIPLGRFPIEARKVRPGLIFQMDDDAAISVATLSDKTVLEGDDR